MTVDGTSNTDSQHDRASKSHGAGSPALRHSGHRSRRSLLGDGRLQRHPHGAAAGLRRLIYERGLSAKDVRLG